MSLGTSRDIVIVGGRAIGRSLLDILQLDGRYRPVCIIDDGLAETQVCGVPVRDFANYDLPCTRALLALGMPADKQIYLAKAQAIGLSFESYVSPLALVGGSTRIGSGSIIFPFASLIDGAELGSFVYLSLYAGAGKSARVGDFCTLMNYSSVRGAHIGQSTVIAGNSHVLDGAHVGKCSWVAPGVVVRKPVGDNRIALGGGRSGPVTATLQMRTGTGEAQ